jgi:hypothetical protein
MENDVVKTGVRAQRRDQSRGWSGAVVTATGVEVA